MSKLLEPLRAAKIENGIKTFEDEVKAAILMDPAKRDPLQAMMYHTAEPRVDFDEEPDARTLRGLKGDDGKRYAELKKQLAEFDSLKPAPLPEGQFMIDISATAPPTYILRGGNLDAEGRRSAARLPLDSRSHRRQVHAARRTELHRPPHRAGRMAYRSEESAGWRA